MKIILISFMVLLYKNDLDEFNLLDADVGCDMEYKMGICQNDLAYTLAQALTIQNCLDNKDYNIYSAQNLINKFDNCNQFNETKIIEYLIFLTNIGISKFEYENEKSFFSGKPYNSIFVENNIKIINFDEFNSIENQKEIQIKISEDRKIPIMILNFDFQYRNSDGIIEDNKNNYNQITSAVILGWKYIENKFYWIIRSNYGNYWGYKNQNISYIRNNNLKIKKVYYLEI